MNDNDWDNVFTEDDSDANRGCYAIESIERFRHAVAKRVVRQLRERPTKRAWRAETAEAHCLFRLVVGRVPNDAERAKLDREEK